MPLRHAHTCRSQAAICRLGSIRPRDRDEGARRRLGMGWVSTSLTVAAVACGGSARHTASIEVAGSAGICAKGPTPGATSAVELLVAGGDAIERGCPREAMLDAVAARGRRDLGNRGPWVRLLIEEAGRDACTVSVTGPSYLVAPSADFPDETWAHELNLESTYDDIESIAKGVRDGAIPAIARDSGRLGRFGIRTTPTMPCVSDAPPNRAPDGTELSPQDMRAMGVALQAEVFANAGYVSKDPAVAARLKAFGAAWTCDLAAAARHYDEAARLDPVHSLEAHLRAWEARYMPGGDASLTVVSIDREHISRSARELEAAALGKGLTYQAGIAALAALDAITTEHGDAATEARAMWLRAELELRMLGRPADAKKHAARAAEFAIAARRANLLDGARLVSALAAIEVGDTVEAARTFAALFVSVTERGALTARSYIAVRVCVGVRELQARGRNDTALSLAAAARNQAPELSVLDTANLAAMHGMALNTLGRSEEAIEVFDAGVAAVRASRDRFPSREPMALKLRAFAAVIAFTQGDFDELRALDNPERRDVMRALQAEFDGDLAQGRALLRTTDDPLAILQLSNLTCAADPQLLVAAADEAREASLEFTAKAEAGGGGPIAPLQSKGLATALHSMGRLLMACGATTQNLDVFRAGQKLVDGSEPQPSDAAYEAAASGRANDAAAIWAEIATDSLAQRSAFGWSQNARVVGNHLQDAAGAYLRARPPRVAQALELLEHSRAVDLRVVRMTRRDDQIDPALAKVTEIERKIAATGNRLRTIVGFEEKPGGASFASAHAALSADLARLAAERDAAARQVSMVKPEAYRAAALAKPRSTAELQALLGDDEVLVYYMVDALEAWAIVVDRRRASAVALDALDRNRLPQITTRIAAYQAARTAATGGNLRGLKRAKVGDSSLQALRVELYDLLVSPLEPYIARGKRVLIVPDIHTQQIAFPELGAKSWIARNPLRLLPGAYLLADRTESRGRSALVVGDPDFGGGARAGSSRGVHQGNEWEQLPGTRGEATEIGKILGAAPVLGVEASEATIKKRMVGAAIVHLATHGVAEPRRASSSVIVLAKPRSGDIEDGFLHAYEVERLYLDARLVVLSACETGKGRALGSEGILALDRAFLVAGANAVVSTLWSVPDAPTAALMARFYAELASGRTADVSLANAMLYVRSNPAWSDPLNWAAFRLVGSGAGVHIR